MANREDFIREEIKKQGYNIKDFCKKINMPYTTLLSALNKSIGGMSLDNAFKVCQGLNISIELLNPYSNNAINKDNIINGIYQQLNPIGKAKADEYITDLSEQSKYTAAKTGTQNSISDEITPLFKQAVQTMTDIKQK